MKVISLLKRWLSTDLPRAPRLPRSVGFPTLPRDESDSATRLQARRRRAASWQGCPSVIEVKNDCFQSYATSIPCLDFNGDFHGVREHGPGLISFFLGDVCGKGLQAAFYQTSCLTLLSQNSWTDLSPEQVVTEVNTVLAAREDDSRYATLIYGRLDLQAKTITLVNAGHPKPFLVSESGEVRRLDCPVGLPIGLDNDHRYQARTFPLAVGDTVILFSDGIVEARNANREFFGVRRLSSLLSESWHLPLSDLTGQILKSVEQFAPKPHDDQSLLVARIGEFGPKSEDLKDESEAVALAFA